MNIEDLKLENKVLRDRVLQLEGHRNELDQQNQRYRETLQKIVEVPPDEPSSVKMALYYQSIALEGLE